MSTAKPESETMGCWSRVVGGGGGGCSTSTKALLGVGYVSGDSPVAEMRSRTLNDKNQDRTQHYIEFDNRCGVW